MYNNIIFIGGVHGVGKGTICQKIKEKLDFTRQVPKNRTLRRRAGALQKRKRR